MPFPYFDRKRLQTHPLKRRINRVVIERDCVRPDAALPALSAKNQAIIRETAERIRRARQQGKPVIMAFGAHLIKNGLGPALISLINDGWLTHLATNGAGVIHDWEFAFLGASSEHVHDNIVKGRFGHWQETGFYINLALAAGAYEGLGYGEAIGSLIANDGLSLPKPEHLSKFILSNARTDPEKAAAAADLLAVMRQFKLKGGQLALAHPCKRYSIQAAAFRLRVPFTAHPMFGHDVIYTHPMNRGAVVGRTAERDFLSFAESVSKLDNGVYISVGSAIMSPMIFEKAFAMAQNLALQKGRQITRHFILVVDLMKSPWDWRKGEPPEDNPAYYLRFCKTFSRVGGAMRYLQADNRAFLPALFQELRRSKR
jgi:hypothetical protein